MGVLGSFQEAGPLIGIKKSYSPRPQTVDVYERSFEVYKDLYKNNRQMFRRLNER